MTARRVCLFFKQKTKTGQTKKIKSAAGFWNIKNVPTQDWITWESSEHKPEWKESFAEAFDAIWEKSLLWLFRNTDKLFCNTKCAFLHHTWSIALRTHNQRRCGLTLSQPGGNLDCNHSSINTASPWKPGESCNWLPVTGTNIIYNFIDHHWIPDSEEKAKITLWSQCDRPFKIKVHKIHWVVLTVSSQRNTNQHVSVWASRHSKVIKDPCSRQIKKYFGRGQRRGGKVCLQCWSAPPALT